MKNKMKNMFGVLGLTIALAGLLVSCEKDHGQDKAPGQEISFSIKCAQTKAQATTTSVLQGIGSFKFVAFDGSDDYFGEGPLDATFVSESSETESCWTTGKEWPENPDQKLDFWSYAPVSEFTTSPTFDVDNTDHTMTFKYTPARDGSRRHDAEDQKDLLVAYSGQRSFNASGADKHRVSVAFNHALSAIRFKIGEVDEFYTNDTKELIEKFILYSINLKGFAAGGTCTVKETGDYDENKKTIAESNMTITWESDGTTTNYQQFFDAEFDYESTYESSGKYLHELADKPEAMFMIMPQTIQANQASMGLNFGTYEYKENTLGGEKSWQYVQLPTRTVSLPEINFEAGYIYDFTINIKRKGNTPDPDDPDDPYDVGVYIILTEKVPWTYINETKEYADIATGYPKIEFKNVYKVEGDEGNRVFAYQYPEALECSIKLASPKGAKLLIKLEKDFDAFKYEFITSDQIPEEGDQTNVEPIRFRLIPIKDPQREYVTNLSLSLRLVNGREVNIDEQVQPKGKYQIILQKAL